MPVSLAPKGAGPSAARALARSALRPPPPDADETPQSRRRHSEAGPGLKPRPAGPAAALGGAPRITATVFRADGAQSTNSGQNSESEAN